jgi:hypothetical protein
MEAAFGAPRTGQASRDSRHVRVTVPLRSRVAAITGAPIGVDTVPMSAFRPFPFE